MSVFIEVCLIILLVLLILFLICLGLFVFFLDKVLDKHCKKYSEWKKKLQENRYLESVIKSINKFNLEFFELKKFSEFKDEDQNNTRFYLSNSIKVQGIESEKILVFSRDITGKLISYGENEISIKFQKDGLKRLVFIQDDNKRFRLKAENNEFQYGNEIYKLLSKNKPFLCICESNINKKIKSKKSKKIVYEIGAW